MRNRYLKRCFTVAAAASVLMMAFGPSAQAATVNTSPHWFNGHIDQFRAVGSETTFYVMNAINNLYSQSAIFGCTLLTTDFQTCNTGVDGPDTDTLDNYDRDEFNNGEGIGSGNGLGILCGTPSGAIPADFARSSRPANGSSSCETSLTFLPYGTDALAGDVFNKEHAVTSGSGTTPIGPVASGWRNDGDSVNCNFQAAPGPHFNNGVNACDGVPFTNISNTGVGSVAFKIWCDTSASGISDWGQLTDPTAAVGSGASIGVPINIWGVNTGSGTYSVWKSFIGCDPNTKMADADHLIQENNAPQIRQVETRLHPSDPILVENHVEESIYWGSFGVMNSNAFTKGGGSFTKINGTTVSAGVETPALATFRNIFNAFAPGSLKSSVAGFLNWICSTNDADHGVDITTGKNYNQELNNTISTKFGFPRQSCPISTPVNLTH